MRTPMMKMMKMMKMKSMLTKSRNKLAVKSLSLFAAAALAFSGIGGSISAEAAGKSDDSRTLIVDELDSSETSVSSTPEESSTQFQSLDDYANGALSYDGPSTSGNFTVQTMSGSADDYEIIKSYVELLADCMNMELVESYEQSYTSTFFSFGLNYTGTAKVSETKSMQFADEVMCNMNIYGTIKKNSLDVHLWIPGSMETVDMGWRYGEELTDTTIAGESAGAGLYLLFNGGYQTTDERLATLVGNAYIVMDGEDSNHEAEYEISDSKEELIIENFYGTESVYFTAPLHQLTTGDIYTYDDVRGDNDSKEANNWGPSGFNMGTTFAVYHNGNWRYAQYGDSYIEDCTIRVMYYEEDVVAVFYIYVMLTTDPYEIEILAAVDLSTAEAEEDDDASSDSSSSGSSVSSSSVSSSSSSSGSSGVTTKCTKCHGSGTITCTACDGAGGKYVYGSTANYSGKSSTTSKTWQRCSKCSGSGSQTCTRCGGSGTQ